MAKARGDVSIRLQPEGGVEVVRTFREVEAAGVAAATKTKAATEAATTAARGQVQALKEVSTQAALAARAPSATQARIDQITGVTGGGAGRADMAARVLFAADDGAERRAALLRAQIDPLGAAQARYNDELREYDQLLGRAKISEAEAIALKARSKAALDAETAALQRNTSGLSRNQVASRLNLTRQGADVLVTAAMGMNPAMIAIQQGPQILDALATSGIKARASLLLVGGALGLTAAAAGVLAAAWNDAEGQSNGLERAVGGLGRVSGVTAVELETLALATADQAEVSVRSAREQASAYVQTGRIGTAVIAELIRVGKDYAATYGVDAKQATSDLAKRMLDPAKAARDWTRELGLLDQKTIEHIESLQKQGDLTGAQTVLSRELTDALAGQADRIGVVESAWDAASRAVSNYWDQLGRALYTTPEERLAGIDRQIANGRRTGANENWMADRESDRWVLGTRLGIEQMVAGQQSAAAAENQAAQDAADRAARAGRGGSRGGSGDSAEAEAERARRDALARDRRDEDRRAGRQLEQAQAYQDLDRVRELEREEEVRRRIRELVDDDLSAMLAGKMVAAEMKIIDMGRAEIKARELAAQEDRQQLLVYEAEGNHALAQGLRDRLDLEERILELRRLGVDVGTAEAVAASQLGEATEAREASQRRAWIESQTDREVDLARLRGNEPLARALEINRETEELARRIEEMLGLDFGEGRNMAARQVAEAADAEAQGAAREWVQGLVSDIRNSGLSDALSNQLDRAADRFLEKMIDGLFDLNAGGGGSGGGNWLSTAFGFLFGRNANGTDWWAGGPSLVGERGPELVNLPRGSQVIDAERTRRLLAGPGGRAGGGKVEMTVISRLEVPPGYVPDRQLAAMLEATHESAAQAGARMALREMPRAQQMAVAHQGG